MIKTLKKIRNLFRKKYLNNHIDINIECDRLTHSGYRGQCINTGYRAMVNTFKNITTDNQ